MGISAGPKRTPAPPPRRPAGAGPGHQQAVGIRGLRPAEGGEWAGSNASRRAGRGQNAPTSPSQAAQGAGPHPGGCPAKGPGQSRRLATPRPARPRSAAGACPQHGLACLVRALAVGRRLRAAAPCPGPAREPPQLPSAADPPRPLHGAQQAAALPNRVSVGLRRDAGLRKADAWGERGLRGGGRGKGLGVRVGIGLGDPEPEKSDRRGGLEKPLIWGN